MSARRRYLLIGVGLLAVIAVGCARADGTAAVEAPTQEDLDAVYAAVNSPLSLAEQVDLMNAQDRLVEQCMQEAGFDFDLPGQTIKTAFPSGSAISDLETWLFADPDTADTSGYGVALEAAAREGQPEPVEPIDESRMTDDELAAFHRTFHGDPDGEIVVQQLDGGSYILRAGGCHGEALRALYGDIHDYLAAEDVRVFVVNELRMAAFGDPAVEDALDKWRSCMEGIGHSATDPGALVETIYDRAPHEDQAGLQAMERELATADVTCKLQTQLHIAVARAVYERADELLPKHTTDLNRLADIERTAVERASTIPPS